MNAEYSLRVTARCSSLDSPKVLRIVARCNACDGLCLLEHMILLQAMNLAFSDVRAAFLYYLEEHNDGRPFYIASHSQGSCHATRLLEELIDKHECAARLVAAYVLGMGIPLSKFDPGGGFSTLHPSSGPLDLQCVIGWQLRTFRTSGECDYLKQGMGPGHYFLVRAFVLEQGLKG